MTRAGMLRLAIAAFSAILLQSAPASAQATRTWVSGVGDDANPCSRTAPCKTFAGAISKTAAGGEISVLDPGGFGAVTITKSLSIVADGNEGSVLVSGQNAIIVSAGATDVINLDGLHIEGLGTGLSGVRFLAGGELHIRNCVIRGFQAAGAGIGLDIQPTATSRVFVSDTDITKNNSGILIRAATGGAPGATVFFDRVQVVRNTGAGITADGAKARIRLNNSTITNNGSGLVSLNSGEIISFGNNANEANGPANNTNGAPTSTIPLQ